MSEPAVPTYRLVTSPIQSAIQSAIWGLSGVAVEQPKPEPKPTLGGLSLGDVIITDETQWTDVNGVPVYSLTPLPTVPNLAGSPFPYKLVTPLGA